MHDTSYMSLITIPPNPNPNPDLRCRSIRMMCSAVLRYKYRASDIVCSVKVQVQGQY